MGKRRVARLESRPQQPPEVRLLPRKSMLRVVVTFVALLAVLLPFPLFSGGWAGWRIVTSGTAVAGAAGARFFGVNAVASGNMIRLATRSLEIDPACTAVTLLAVYIALVLAYPVKWRERGLGLLVGILAIPLANLLRIVAVASLSGYLNTRAFVIVHDYLFEYGMVFVVMVLWAVWLGFVKRTA